MGINYHQLLEADRIYHIYNSTIDEVKLFRDTTDYDDFLHKIEKYFDPYFDIYSYCLLPNHFHILAKVRSI